MKTSKLLARAALPAGAALLSLSAWAVASSSMSTQPDSARQVERSGPVEPSAAAASPAVADEPVLAPQVGNMKYGCRADAIVEAMVATPAAVVASPAAPVTVIADEPVLAPQVGNMKYGCRPAPVVAVAAGQTR